MKSIRDLVRKMPESKKGLEEIVRSYSPEINEAVERDPKAKAFLEKSIDDSFEKYSKYLGGLTQKISAGGHAVGYSADAWLATGDIIGSLGGKFINLLAQIPEKAYSVVYATQTGNYMDSMQNIFEGIVSYLPGFTVVDQGLSRIIQKRMVKDVIYNVEKEFGNQRTWYQRAGEESQRAGYKGAKVRRDNIIRANFNLDDDKKEVKRRKAA